MSEHLILTVEVSVDLDALIANSQRIENGWPLGRERGQAAPVVREIEQWEAADVAEAIIGRIADVESITSTDPDWIAARAEYVAFCDNLQARAQAYRERDHLVVSAEPLDE